MKYEPCLAPHPKQLGVCIRQAGHRGKHWTVTSSGTVKWQGRKP